MLPPLFIDWTVPAGIPIGSFTLRFYGLLFASGFACAYLITQWVFRREGVPEKWLDPLLLYGVLGGVIGARLGHVFFYGWEYYQEFWWEIPMIWKGGLASHGGGLGLILAFYLFSRRISKQPILWLSDRLVMSVSLGGGLIRMGNLLNHEIVGAKTQVSWGFIFHNYGGDIFPVPRHPAQLYEAIAYFSMCALLLWLYRKGFASRFSGFLTGLYLSLTFSARFFIEFVKENQEIFEDQWMLNMGQWLSIPLILLGLWFVFRSFSKKPSPPKNNL